MSEIGEWIKNPFMLNEISSLAQRNSILRYLKELIFYFGDFGNFLPDRRVVRREEGTDIDAR